MKHFILIALGLFAFGNCFSQSPIGTWITKDDETGKQKAHVKIFESKGKLYGKIVKLLVKPKATVCDYCDGKNKDKPFMGMHVIYDMKKKGEEWTGLVYKADMGKEFKGALKMIDKNTLRVTGKFLFITRHQFWKRLN